MMVTPDLSVIIPTYQRRASVERLLHALARQTLDCDAFEVILAIDGSHDGTLEMVETFSAPYQLTPTWQPNSGRARARNAGIHAARGAVLVFFDDDMEPAPDCLEWHAQGQPTGSRVAMIGAVPICRQASDPPIADYMAAKFQQHLDRLAQPDHQFELRDFYSGHFSIRREVLFEIGLFDETFQLYGNEDLELAWRLRAADVKLIYQSKAVAYQYYSKDFSALAQDTIAKGRTAVLLVNKHPDALTELRLNTANQDSWRWRWARSGLLLLSRWVPATPHTVTAFVSWLESRNVKHLHLYYRFVLDYLYWLGASHALRENRSAGHRPTALAGKSKA
jgi:glycosyltransferase involved in cell wall biosynthesis